eukprot:CAMPEP_0114375268 /NCGR_PEP_ID=MMETSP0101-20121206/36176_1 /TAXON_ID=38822 ORGANISM="Pteridomonas danica, Strain PT" /NCGR_SAMPLE_ID=MMETSP0101 /ASSEMBLY_ACC=CAM_ASM_000211 /LENGTH=74 /DNA_ID=CAMNT_0001529299 /DNA_START=203 /DNA_END=427 /DNA_ORIENTATION=+
MDNLTRGTPRGMNNLARVCFNMHGSDDVMVVHCRAEPEGQGVAQGVHFQVETLTDLVLDDRVEGTHRISETHGV